MSLSGYKKFIEPNDTVILYLCNNLHAVLVQEKIRNKNGILVENVYQTPFGALKVKDLIGVQYGSKVELSKGWGHVLQPTPELWTLCLPHRTQIIYSPDISMILCQLDLTPGKVVVEAGTGSGSLTHAFIRCVKPKGFVFTFDFHPQRAQFAQKEFQLHGVDQFVSVKCCDVLTCGFGKGLNSRADAVFLDLPKPWLGVSWAKHAIRYDKGGRFASFSPCIEQVQKTNEALKREGFKDIVTVEVLQTELKIHERAMSIRDLTFLKNRASTNPVTEKASNCVKFVSGAWPLNTPGHTGYMTFATMPPDLKRYQALLAIKDVGTMTSNTKRIADKRTHENDGDEGPSTKNKDYESASGSRCKNIDQKESTSASMKDFYEKDCKKDGVGDGPVTA